MTLVIFLAHLTLIDLDSTLALMTDFDVNTFTELCPDPVIAVDRKGVISIFNPAAEQLLGYRHQDVVGQMSIATIYGGIERAKRIQALMLSDEYGAVNRIEGYETEAYSSEKRVVPIRLSASIMDLGQGVQGSIGFFHDLSARKTLEARLKELSVTDDLTGLYNQRHFYESLESELERARRYKHLFSVICIDLDKFKQVNDSLGHLEGDRLLRFVGQVVKADLRLTDLAFRYGGDEFMLLLPETLLSSAREIAERLRRAFAKYKPFDAGNGMVSAVSLSMGVTHTDGHESVESLISRADKAMYQAKRNGGNQVVCLEQHKEPLPLSVS